MGQVLLDLRIGFHKCQICLICLKLKVSTLILQIKLVLLQGQIIFPLHLDYAKEKVIKIGLRMSLMVWQEYTHMCMLGILKQERNAVFILKGAKGGDGKNLDGFIIKVIGHVSGWQFYKEDVE
ncbi:unnamed protein product (macronuclear) [Paramecium tetraurelia]|uniref:Uncharacterized protein n=1 Tax=Paramecium tetraurelia TaxID=5888 RepID=A0C7J7_PARTE|nr:uncharacterized protein GSPATT00035894001 [Paramecium tetraurelia]CAK66764.1 unnamed protein product [Paramecium tetraurelia]|eukprot:XP_001434161.1 hypothetical protein (macronuclear) [Paramecium tetraurelia strain d4-2]